MIWTLIATFTLLVFAISYLGLCWWIVARMVRPIRHLPERTPAELGFLDAEQLTLRTEDGMQLSGCLIPSSGDRVVVLVHGLNSHGWDAQTPHVVRAYVNAGFHVLVFDLRGQGNSDGVQLGLGWLERQDVRAAVRSLLERGFAPGKIGVHGTSYGAAAALLAAAETPEIGAIIADSAFADVRDVLVGEMKHRTHLPILLITLLMPGLQLLARAVYSIRLGTTTPESAIAAVVPRTILLIHGSEDSIIPVDQSRRLQTAAGETAEFWILTGRGHTEGVMLEDGSFSPLREVFLGRVVDFFATSLHS